MSPYILQLLVLCTHLILAGFDETRVGMKHSWPSTSAVSFSSKYSSKDEATTAKVGQGFDKTRVGMKHSWPPTSAVSFSSKYSSKDEATTAKVGQGFDKTRVGMKHTWPSTSAVSFSSKYSSKDEATTAKVGQGFDKTRVGMKHSWPSTRRAVSSKYSSKDEATTAKVGQETSESIIASQRTSPEKLSIFVENGNTFSKTSSKSYQKFQKITGMTWDHRNHTLFVYQATSKISILKNFNGTFNKHTEFEDIRTGVSNGWGSVAFDWISGNLYWTDSFHNWIAMQPAYIKDESMFKVIVSDGLRRPEGLAIDPLARYMFWSDKETRDSIIERSTLSGTDRKIIAFQSLRRILSMVADVDKQMLYWVDRGRGTLETCDYSGLNRRVIDRRKGSYPTSVDISFNYIYTAMNGHGKIFLYDKKTHKYKNSITADKVHALSVFNTTTQQPIRGIKTTNFYSKGIVVTDGSKICMLSINAVSNGPRLLRCEFIGRSSVGAVAVTRNDIIFFDRATKTLKVIQMNRDNVIHTLIDNVGSVSDLEYDWVDENILWIDDEKRSIKMMDKNNPSEILIITHDLRDPQSLAIDVYSKLIFWTDSDEKSSRRHIFKLNYKDNNSTATTFMETEIPRGLFIDVNTDRLFWEETHELKSVRIDGSDYKPYDPIGMEAVHFLLYKDYAVWTNSSAVMFSRYLHDHDDLFISSLPDISAVKDIALFDPLLWKVIKGRCTIDNGGCEQICLPERSYPVCRCDFGFTLNSDNKTCNSGSPLKENFALICDAKNDRIYQLSLNGTKIQALGISGLDTPLAVEYHPGIRRLFVTEYSGALKSISEDGKNVSTMLQLDLSCPYDVELDIETNQIFFTVLNKTTEYNGSYIGVILADTKVHRTLISGLGRTLSLAIHPGRGLLFWTDHGTVDYIGKSSMDGQDKTKLISTNIKIPVGIAIDYTANVLYWSDYQYDTIESCDLFGGNRRKILADNRADIRRILIRGSFIYYTAWNKRKVTKADKLTGRIIPWMSDYPGFTRIDDIDIIPKDKKPENSLCRIRKGNCSTFCFPTPTHRVCGCEDGVKLLPDRQRCENVYLCPEVNIPHGELEPTCLRYAKRSCEFRCDVGFEPTNGKENISCGPLGRWEEDIDDLCQEVQEDQTTESDPQIQKRNIIIALLIIIFVVILVALF